MSHAGVGERPLAQRQPLGLEGTPGWALAAMAALGSLAVTWSAGLVSLRAGDPLVALNLLLAGLLVAPVAGVISWAVSDIVDGLRQLAVSSSLRPGAQAGAVTLRLLSVVMRAHGVALVALVVLRQAGADLPGTSARLLGGGPALDLVLRLSTGAMICAAILVAVFRLIVVVGRRQALSGDRILLVALLVAVPGFALLIARPQLTPGYGLLVGVVAASSGLARLMGGRAPTRSLLPSTVFTLGAVLMGVFHAVALPLLPPVLAFLFAPLVPPKVADVASAAMGAGESVLGPAVWLVAGVVAMWYLTALWKLAAGLRHLADLGTGPAHSTVPAGSAWNAARVGLAAGSLGALVLTGGTLLLARLAISHFGISLSGLAQVSPVVETLLGWLASLDSGQLVLHLAVLGTGVVGLLGLDAGYWWLLSRLPRAEARPAGVGPWAMVAAAVLLSGAVATSVSVFIGGVIGGAGLRLSDSTGSLIRIALVGQSLGTALLVVLVGIIGFRWVLGSDGWVGRAAPPDPGFTGFHGIRWVYLLRAVVLPVAVGAWLMLVILSVRWMLVGSAVAGWLVGGSLWFFAFLLGMGAILAVPYLGAWLALALPPPAGRDGEFVDEVTGGLSGRPSTARFSPRVSAGPAGATGGFWVSAVRGSASVQSPPFRKGLPGAAPLHGAAGVSLGGPSSGAPTGKLSGVSDYGEAEPTLTARVTAPPRAAPGAGGSPSPAAGTDSLANVLERILDLAKPQDSPTTTPAAVAVGKSEDVEIPQGGAEEAERPAGEPEAGDASLSTTKLPPMSVPVTPRAGPVALAAAESVNAGVRLSFTGLDLPLVWRRDGRPGLEGAMKGPNVFGDSSQELSFTLALRASRAEDGFGVWLAGVILNGNVFSCPLGRFRLAFSVVREEGGVFTAALRAMGLEGGRAPLSREERKSLREVLSRDLIVVLRLIRRFFGSAVTPIMTVSATQVEVVSGPSKNRVHVCPWLLDAESELGAGNRIVWRDSGEDLTADLGQLSEWMHIVAVGLAGKLVLLGVSLKELEALPQRTQNETPGAVRE